MDDSAFVPLRSVWSRDGELSVVFAALEDAGFHPILDCDPRGWMYYYGWPFGSSRPVTIFLPGPELETAREFLSAEFDPLEGDDEESSSYYSAVHDYRRLFYLGWLMQVVGVATLAVSVIGVFRAITGTRESQ